MEYLIRSAWEETADALIKKYPELQNYEIKRVLSSEVKNLLATQFTIQETSEILVINIHSLEELNNLVITLNKELIVNADLDCLPTILIYDDYIE